MHRDGHRPTVDHTQWLRPAAKADLIEICRYIARDSPARAAACPMRIEGKLGVLSNQLGIGASRPDTRR